MIDIITILIVMKIGALIFEDVVSAVRGKPSPRKQARERRETADRAAGRQPRRVGSAVGGYLADLIDDASQHVRDGRPERWERRRDRQARRRSRKRAKAGHGTVLVEIDRGTLEWRGVCDLCGWQSRPYRIKQLADEQARRHADTHADTDVTPYEPQAPEAQPGTQSTSEGTQLNPVQPVESEAIDPVADEGADDEAGQNHRDADVIDMTSRASRTSHAAETATVLASAYRAQGRCTHIGDGQICGELVGIGEHCHDHSRPNRQPNRRNETSERGTMNTEAAGPDAIRAAFAEGSQWSEESATSAGSSAAQLEDASEAAAAAAATFTQAAENYESERMASSTVEHLREAAQHATAAAAAYGAAAESARAAETALHAADEAFAAATADFNARDGAVADAAQEAGNLANRDVLEG